MPIPVLVALSLDSYGVSELDTASVFMQLGGRILEFATGLGIVSGILGRKFSDSQIDSYKANPILMSHIKSLHVLSNVKL